MKPPQKIQNPLFVDLPNPSNESHIVIEFPYGYVFESDEEFGAGHLYEHHAVAMLSRMLGRDRIMASIGVDTLRFEWTTTTAKVAQEVAQTLRFFSETLPFDATFFERERTRVLIETSEQLLSFDTFSRNILLTTFLGTPKALKRSHFEEQVKNIPTIPFMTIATLHERLRNAYIPSIAIGAYRLSKETKQSIIEICTSAGYAHPTIETKRSPATFLSTRSRTVHHPAMPAPLSHITFLIPAYPLTRPLSDRLAVGFLARQIDRRFEKEVYSVGVYHTDWEYWVGLRYSFVRFSTFVPNSKIANVKKIFTQTLQHLTDDLGMAAELREYIRARQVSAQKRKQNNRDLMDWMSADLSSNAGRMTGPTEVTTALKSLTTERVRKVLKDLFVEHKKTLLIIPEKSE